MKLNNELIDIGLDCELIRNAVGTDAQLIAYHRGKSEMFVRKQYEPTYLNFWSNAKKWIVAKGQVSLAKVELYENDFELFIRKLKQSIKKDLVLPFPIERIQQLILIRRQIDEMLTA